MVHEKIHTRLVSILYHRLGMLCHERLLSLIRRLDVIMDIKLRGRTFLRALAQEPATVAVEMLRSLEYLTSLGHPQAQSLFLELLNEQVVREVFDQGMIEEIWRIGRVRGHMGVLEPFFYTSTDDLRLEEAPRLPPDMQDIPLGRRKALARTSMIAVLERLVLDNDAAVIRNLLSNPRVTEREVVRIASRRPNSPAILSTIASDRRWLSRYSVKKSLVYNPYTPINISVPLLKFLARGDLAELCRHSTTNGILKRAAQDLLARSRKKNLCFSP